MLERILAVSGKAGLYRVISQGKNAIIAEQLETKKRTPIHAKDRVVSLRDISMFTEEEDVALEQVLENFRLAQEGKTIDEALLKDDAKLKEFMAIALPTYDRERVYPSDMRKLFRWYNILINDGFTSFIDAEEESQTNE